MTPVLLILAGLIGGFYGSNVGSGGLISFSVLLFAGLPTHVAIATNRFAVVFGEAMSVLEYRRHEPFSLKTAAIVGFPAVLGSLIGSNLMVKAPEEILNIIVAIFLVMVLLVILFKPGLGREEKKLLRRHKIYLGIGAFFLGIYGGFMGTGFGTFIMLLLAGSGMTFIRSAALARLTGFLVSSTAALYFIANNSVQFADGAFLAAGMVVGCIFGVRTGLKYGNEYIRKLLIVVVVLAVSQLVWKTIY